LRALGRTADAREALEAAATFHRDTGGGEQQALGDTLLAALDADSGRLTVLLREAQREGNAPAEIFALDALARATGNDALYVTADARMESAAHFITERDRVDRHAD
jgi:hypothetical protein